ncbi:MAG: GGDEF domain-containing protein [Limnothrix sp. RL_2_0]|nr:GGDEF domain-containing protein [Limnothrix sp. RL_2_0]
MYSFFGKIIRKQAKYLEKKSFIFHVVVGLALIGFIGFLDLVTGNELSFSLFYLLPILWMTWFSTPKFAIITDIFSVIIWFAAERASGMTYSHPSISLWNTGIRLCFFLIVTLLLLELKKALEQEKQLSRIDPLTGAANKRHFIDLLTLEMLRCDRYQRPLSIAYIDLDNFKMVNDKFGHSVGDQLLCIIVDHITKNIRNIDLIARLGGDEFVVLLPEIAPENAKSVMQRLQNSLLLEMQNHYWPVTFSIGLVTCLTIDTSIDELIKLVDNLMYDVKKQGKNAISHIIYP